MSESTTPVIAGQIEGMAEALEQAHANGMKEGRAEGYAQGRVDASAILGSEEASGRKEAAADLAGDPAISPERALSLLGKMPKAEAKGEAFAKLMEGRAPDVGNGEPEQSEHDAKAARLAELKQIASNASPRR